MDIMDVCDASIKRLSVGSRIVSSFMKVAKPVQNVKKNI